MALPYDTSPTLPRFSPALTRLPRLTPTVREHTRREPSPTVTRLHGVATSPTTALVVMLLGLALLFVMPIVGLPFVAVVVLPAVVYHLRAEHRTRLRRARR